MIVPVFGEARKTRKQIKSRLQVLEQEAEVEGSRSILREKYLKRLSPLERQLETLPFMDELGQMIEQAGHSMRAYQLVLIAMASVLGVTLVVWVYIKSMIIAAPLGLLAGTLPFLKISMDSAKRMALFEEQFPEALDVVIRIIFNISPINISCSIWSKIFYNMWISSKNCSVCNVFIGSIRMKC